MVVYSFAAVLATISQAGNTFPGSQTGFDWTVLVLAIAPIITSVVLGAIIGGLGSLIKSEREHRREIENQLSEKKYEVYMTLLDSFNAMLHGDETQRKDNIALLNEARRKMLFYCSDDVINAYLTYIKYIQSEEVPKYIELLSNKNSESNKRTEKIFGDIILAIRRGMGNKETKVTGEDLLYLFDLVIEKTGEDAI